MAMELWNKAMLAARFSPDGNARSRSSSKYLPLRFSVVLQMQIGHIAGRVARGDFTYRLKFALLILSKFPTSDLGARLG